VDDWRTVHDTPTENTGFGNYVADIDTTALKPGEAIVFTLYWPDADRWEGVDYRLEVE